ncbi:unnamed protein product, partial [Symbiodinium necroappetens]
RHMWRPDFPTPLRPEWSCNPAMGAMPPRNVLRQCSKRLRAAPSTASEGCRKGLHGRSRAKSSHKRRSLALSI